MSRESASEAEVLYQVSLAIGSSLDLQQMLRDSSVALLRSLNAYGVQIWQCQLANDLGDLTWQDTFTIPKTLSQLQLAQFDPNLPRDQASFNHLQASLPKRSDYQGMALYWFNLPQFGLLLLLHKGQPLSREMQLSLQVLMNKLAHAAQSCLYDQSLRQQYQSAKQSSKAKSDFMATISHEFRTPLNAIIGFADLLSNQNASHQQVQQISNIHRAAKGLLAMVDEILDFSKLSKNRMQLSPQVFSLSAFGQELFELFEPLAKRKQVDLHMVIDPAIHRHLLADYQRLAQILKNLLGNAIKFTESGSVCFTIQLVSDPDADNALLEFAVTDTGIGMSEEQAKDIFTPFHQADNSISRRFGGTGLGLSICQDLAQLMSSRIEVSSQLGQGSRFGFRVQLPFADAQPVAPPPSRTARPCWQGKRILVVEDAELNQLVIGQYLQQMAIEVDIAEDGFKALALVVQQRYDLIFMDLHMPGIDGLETTQRLRQMPELQSVPIVALTAAVSIEDRQACFSVGMQDFLTKPLDAEALVQLLHRWLGDVVSPPPPSPPSQVFGVAQDNDFVSQPIIDMAILDRLRAQLGDAALSTLLVSLETTMQAQLPQMWQLLAAGDLSSLQRLAHSLKSTAGTLGGKRLATIARMLEQACKEQARAPRLEFLLEELQTAWQFLSQQLHT